MGRETEKTSERSLTLYSPVSYMRRSSRACRFESFGFLPRSFPFARATAIVVWRLDRLARSLKDLIAQAEELRSRGVGLKSLKEAIDTDSPTGQLVFHIFGALAEFERALIRERTQAGLRAARARGRKGGRRKRLGREQRTHAVELYRARRHTVKQICALTGISRATLYAYVEEFSKQT